MRCRDKPTPSRNRELAFALTGRGNAACSHSPLPSPDGVPFPGAPCIGRVGNLSTGVCARCLPAPLAGAPSLITRCSSEPLHAARWIGCHRGADLSHALAGRPSTAPSLTLTHSSRRFFHRGSRGSRFASITSSGRPVVYLRLCLVTQSLLNQIVNRPPPPKELYSLFISRFHFCLLNTSRIQ